jgi:3-isopropylmalate dehydrogenase
MFPKVPEHHALTMPNSGNVAPKRPPARVARWTDCLGHGKTPSSHLLIGVLPGEGVGPEIIQCALEVLSAVTSDSGVQTEIRTGVSIGRDAERECGQALSAEAIRFCEEIFAGNGAILNGPGGGRYVYDLRKQFDLFFKISPLRIATGLPEASRLRREAVGDVDILIARENSGGAYQGDWAEGTDATGGKVASHSFQYSEMQVRRFLHAAARLAAQRRGNLTVVWKESGVPAISKLWRACADEAARTWGLRYAMVDIDLMAYRLVQDAEMFDVIAAPNLFGDILADLGSVLLGSRGVSFSGNYTARGEAVYQTNHGAAYDLAGADRANPAGQIFSLAMMLRESFGLQSEADCIEEAVRSVWREGWRTEDVSAPETRIIGTREMGNRIAARAGQLAREHLRSNGH